MKLKIAQIVCIIAGLSDSALYAQRLGLPSRETLESRARLRGTLEDGPKTDGIEYIESDFEPPALGLLRGADIKRLKAINSIVSGYLSAAPITNQGTNRFLTMSAINMDIEKCVASGKQKDLFGSLDNLIKFSERDTSGESECAELASSEAYIMHSGAYLIRALSYHIVHEQGVVATDLLRQAVRLFGNGRLVDETAWDVDDPMPVDAAGIFILNPGLAVEELKKRPVKRVRYFLANITEPAEFFERYVGEGDGLEVLKAKYAANRAVIDAKHREVVAWLAAQPKE